MTDREHTMGTVMTDLDREIAAYDKLRADLENQHMGDWIIVFDEKLIGVFSSFDDAAKEAVQKFGRGPYLIRQVGAPPITMPASVVYHLRHNESTRTREKQIAEVKEEIEWIEPWVSSQANRILARLEAILADLQQGMAKP